MDRCILIVSLQSFRNRPKFISVAILVSWSRELIQQHRRYQTATFQSKIVRAKLDVPALHQST